jgi:hypothetical protein
MTIAVSVGRLTFPLVGSADVSVLVINRLRLPEGNDSAIFNPVKP